MDIEYEKDVKKWIDKLDSLCKSHPNLQSDGHIVVVGLDLMISLHWVK